MIIMINSPYLHQLQYLSLCKSTLLSLLWEISNKKHQRKMKWMILILTLAALMSFSFQTTEANPAAQWGKWSPWSSSGQWGPWSPVGSNGRRKRAIKNFGSGEWQNNCKDNLCISTCNTLGRTCFCPGPCCRWK